MNFVALFKALSDESRVRIVSILFQGDMCACKMVDYLHVTQSTASRHLSALHQAGIVTYRKDGRKHIYSLNRKLPEPVLSLFDFINNESPINVDQRDFEEVRGALNEV